MKRCIVITFCALCAFFLCSCFEKSDYPPLPEPEHDTTVDDASGDQARDDLWDDLAEGEDSPGEAGDPSEAAETPEPDDAADAAEDPPEEEPAAEPDADAAQEDDPGDSGGEVEEEAEV